MAKATSTVSTQKKRSPRKPADILGYAWDGTPIARPPFKPKSFTVSALRRVVDKVRREQAEAKLQAG